MKSADPLLAWRIALQRDLLAAGYHIWSGAPKDHPYIRYEPTNTVMRPRTTASLSPAKFRRAVARAYATEHLIPWCPGWLHAIVWPNDERRPDPDDLPGDTEKDRLYRLYRCVDVVKIALAYRYDPKDPIADQAALDACMRLGGAVAVMAYITRRAVVLDLATP